MAKKINDYSIIKEELDETEGDTYRLSDWMLCFGFDRLEASTYQDIVNRNVQGGSDKGRGRS